jgi:inner membrane protease ATP23
VLANVNTVSYIVNVLGELGRPFTADNVKCVTSFEAISTSRSSSELLAALSAEAGGGDSGPQSRAPNMAEAGYMWTDSPIAKKGDIVLHEDQLRTREDIERSLRHELIHAFDDARGYVEPTNCYHHACSEIRAARLSGDCFIGQELGRGNVDLFASRNCVKRRAAMAVENNPMCRNSGARAVEVMFGACYTDYEPFVAPLYSMGNAPAPPKTFGDLSGFLWGKSSTGASSVPAAAAGQAKP